MGPLTSFPVLMVWDINEVPGFDLQSRPTMNNVVSKLASIIDPKRILTDAERLDELSCRPMRSVESSFSPIANESPWCRLAVARDSWEARCPFSQESS